MITFKMSLFTHLKHQSEGAQVMSNPRAITWKIVFFLTDISFLSAYTYLVSFKLDALVLTPGRDALKTFLSET